MLLHGAGDTLVMATLTMDLPDKLTEKAGAAGLLASDALESMFRENARICAVVPLTACSKQPTCWLRPTFVP